MTIINMIDKVSDKSKGYKYCVDVSIKECFYFTIKIVGIHLFYKKFSRRKIMKKRIALLLVLAMVMVSFSACTPKTEAPEETPEEETPVAEVEGFYLNLGTGGTAGTYFPLGGAFAEIWNNNIPGANVTSQSTGASAANINLLFDKKIELALVQNDIAFYAKNGTEMFEGQEFDNLRGIAILYNEPIQLITLDPTIKSLDDLKGKTVSVGAIGSGNEANARQILSGAGIDIDNDIQARFLPYSETISGMKDKQIEAAIFTTGMPNAGIQELALQHDLIVVPIDGDVVAKLQKDYPFFTELMMPANTYKGQTEEVSGITVKAMLVATAEMDEELAYQLTKQLYENHDRVVAAHAVGKFITAENAVKGMPIELHPGAERYYKEIGVLE